MKLLLRDALLIALTVVLWHGYQKTGLLPGMAEADSSLGWAILLAVMTTLCGFFVHEWGHLLGAMLARASYLLPRSPFQSPFLFRFNALTNSREQFAIMSAGGFISSAIIALILIALLPLNLLAGQLALGLILLGIGATFVLEVPEFLRVWRGQPIPRSAAYFSPDDNP